MTARSRLLLPSFREAPRDVLGHLREIDPTVELVYMGGGAWALGSVCRNGLRDEVGLRKVRMAMTTVPQHRAAAGRLRAMLWEGKLLLQGFGLIETFKGDPDSRVEEYLRQRTYCWASELDAAWRRIMDNDARSPEAEKEAELERYSTMIDEKRLREAYRWAFKRPVSIIKPEPKAAVA